MKRLITILIAVMCAVCLTFGMVACGGDSDDGKVTYTITVTCSGDNAADTLAAVKVKLLNADGKDATSAQALDKDGKATFRLAPASYTVKVTGPLTDYNVPTDIKVTPTSLAATVALKLKSEQDDDTTVHFKVRLALPDNTPVANTTVQICGTGEGATCQRILTDSRGYAEIDLPAATYEVHVDAEDCPSGYTFDNRVYTVSKDDNEKTVYLDEPHDYKITVVTATVKKTDDGEVIKDENNNTDFEETAKSGVQVSLYREASGGLIADYATGTTGEDGKVTINAKTGSYVVKIKNCPQDYGYIDTLIVDSSVTKTAEVDDTPSVTVTNDEKTIRLVKLGSDAYYRIHVTTDKEITVNVTKKDHEFWYQLDATKPGVYKVESTGELDAYAYYHPGDTSTVNPNPASVKDEYVKYTEDKVAGSDKNFVLEFPAHPATHTEHSVYALRIGAKNVTASGTFKFKITFVKDIEWTNIDPDEPSASLLTSVPAKPAGSTFTWLDFENDTVVYNETDKLYHLGTTDGAVIFVAVGGETYFPRTFDKDFAAAYEAAAGIGFVISDGKTYTHDYGEMLNGYKTAANADGLYPLTTQLKTFLQSYAELNRNTNDLDWEFYGADDKPDQKLYYFACGYYKAA